MVTCPRCQQPVDETVRATCPLCFSPISQAPPPAAQAGGVPGNALPLTGAQLDPQPQPVYAQAPYQATVAQRQPATIPDTPAQPLFVAPGARVSLTGEVIESSAQAGPLPAVGGGGPATSVSQRPGARTSAFPRRDEAPPARALAGGTVTTAIAALAILAVAIGGWYFWMHRTNPKEQALAVYKAFLGQDYKSAYTLCALGPDGAKKYPNAEAFAVEFDKEMNGVAGSGPIGTSLKNLAKSAVSTAAVGNPVLNGDKADVPTSAQLQNELGTLKLAGIAHMVNDGGVWKLDMAGDESQAVASLFGTPSH